ncbi:excinuclease ABC subunit UvrB [Patescibacteria group bacterium]
MKFKLKSSFKPTGDQPVAIKQLVSGIGKKYTDQTLLGVTGSGKTYTMANVIEKLQRPTLIISHNKTLAAQLAAEFKDFFPANAVNYFVSYYDYYQPEAYIARTDTYIEKETDINEEIDRLRHATTTDLLTRRDVIIVASVSCIFGLGPPDEYRQFSLILKKGQLIGRQELLKKLSGMRYERNDIDFHRGTFRVRGEVVDIYPVFSPELAVRVALNGDTIEKLSYFDSLTGKADRSYNEILIVPATHYLTMTDKLDNILEHIKQDKNKEVAAFKQKNKLLEAQRLDQRTRYDLEMIKQTGYCSGIENYSRYFDGRSPGETPSTLIDYFPKDFLLFIDESHMTVPQIRGMYAGDRSRKESLVRYGFRLKSAFDNRPIQFEEFNKKIGQTIYVSATPDNYEKDKSSQIVEQLLRPTGLLDPTIEIKPVEGQIDDLIKQIKDRVDKKQRVLVTTMTKRMAEDLADYLKEVNIKVHYLHSEINTFERLEILRDLRLGEHDVVVGINLLREGLDLPEVSLIAILDADKEGFLRSRTSLIQIMGRAARHQDGHIIMYADKHTYSMKEAIRETERRRIVQEKYNKKHHIKPKTIRKKIADDRLAGAKRELDEELPPLPDVPPEEVSRLLDELTDRMELAAQNLEFEKAAILRDQIDKLKKIADKRSSK